MDWVRGECVGKGAFGTVNLAVYKSTGEVFAVKSVNVQSTNAVLCLENEIRILKQLSSPYVVGYRGDDTTAARRNLHMEFVPGGTVAEVAARSGGLDERAARSVALRVAEALHYLHDVAGVVHGDVKGRNVLVGATGSKLADFGSARFLADCDVAGGPRGTPAWIAPEVARGGSPTPASDVWSLGCTVIEVLTGKHPWSESGAAAVEELVLLIGYFGKRPEAPAWLSHSGRDFLDKCLRRDASERWSCERLLRHPFLAADAACSAAAEAAPSPRTVLDFSVADSDSQFAPECDSEEALLRAKRRIARLASRGPEMGRAWESDSWEAVRWVHEPRSDPSVCAYSNSSRGEMEDGESSGSTVSDTASGHVASSFCCSPDGCCCGRDCCISDCCCKSRFGWKCGVGISCGQSVAAFCILLLSQLRKVLFRFSCSRFVVDFDLLTWCTKPKLLLDGGPALFRGLCSNYCSHSILGSQVKGLFRHASVLIFAHIVY